MEDAAIVGMVFGILGILLIPALIVAILMVVANWKIYKKAGKEGWKCIIPYYNTWTECEFLGLNTNWVWILLGSSFVGGFLDGLLETSLFSYAAYAVAFYFQVLRSISLAQSFGKDTGYGVGILFLQVIFLPMLAFGKAEYLGPKPMSDFVFKNGNNTTPTANPAPQTGAAAVENEILNATPNVAPEQPVAPAQPAAPATKFCTGCGAKLEEGTNFCTSCGTKLN